ncbi:MAG: hypothetical protein ACXW2E_12545, partial [Nitrososphaeraceae archaeon]
IKDIINEYNVDNKFNIVHNQYDLIPPIAGMNCIASNNDHLNGSLNNNNSIYYNIENNIVYHGILYNPHISNNYYEYCVYKQYNNKCDLTLYDHYRVQSTSNNNHENGSLGNNIKVIDVWDNNNREKVLQLFGEYDQLCNNHNASISNKKSKQRNKKHKPIMCEISTQTSENWNDSNHSSNAHPNDGLGWVMLLGSELYNNFKQSHYYDAVQILNTALTQTPACGMLYASKFDEIEQVAVIRWLLKFWDSLQYCISLKIDIEKINWTAMITEIMNGLYYSINSLSTPNNRSFIMNQTLENNIADALLMPKQTYTSLDIGVIKCSLVNPKEQCTSKLITEFYNSIIQVLPHSAFKPLKIMYEIIDNNYYVSNKVNNNYTNNMPVIMGIQEQLVIYSLNNNFIEDIINKYNIDNNIIDNQYDLIPPIDGMNCIANNDDHLNGSLNNNNSIYNIEHNIVYPGILYNPHISNNYYDYCVYEQHNNNITNSDVHSLLYSSQLISNSIECTDKKQLIIYSVNNNLIKDIINEYNIDNNIIHNQYDLIPSIHGGMNCIVNNNDHLNGSLNDNNNKIMYDLSINHQSINNSIYNIENNIVYPGILYNAHISSNYYDYCKLYEQYNTIFDLTLYNYKDQSTFKSFYNNKVIDIWNSNNNDSRDKSESILIPNKVLQLFGECINLIRIQLLRDFSIHETLIKHEFALLQLVNSIFELAIYIPLSIVIQWQGKFIQQFIYYNDYNIQIQLIFNLIFMINNYNNVKDIKRFAFKPP